MPQLFVIIVIHFHCKLFRGLKSTLMHNLSELMISCLFERACHGLNDFQWLSIDYGIDSDDKNIK